LSSQQIADRPHISKTTLYVYLRHRGFPISADTHKQPAYHQDVVVMLSDKLSTPLRFETYLTWSFEERYRVFPEAGDSRCNSKHSGEGYQRPGAATDQARIQRKVLADVLNAEPR
jgi:hypothetical protein